MNYGGERVVTTCRDYERRWNELIDRDRSGSVPIDPVSTDTERVLLDHAADCAACRQLSMRYQILRRVLHSGIAAQVPPTGFADRILAEIEKPSPSAWGVYGETRPWRIRPVAVAMAGTVAMAVGLAFYLTHINRNLRARLDQSTNVLHPTPVPDGHDEGPESETIPAGARNLKTAVADATAATWDLARSASEPAARISRQVLNAATEADREPSLPNIDAGLEPVSTGASVLSLAALAPDTAAAGAMLQQVGDHLATGVRPLSDTARHAFRFLLGPAIAKPDVPANPPAPKGA
jgi:hypothetical protein